MNLQQNAKESSSVIPNVTGGVCERRGIRMRMGGNCYPISAMSDAHHQWSRQGVLPDSRKVCSCVKCDHAECMYVCMYLSMNLFMQAFMYVCMYVRINVYIYMYISMYIRTYVCMHACIIVCITYVYIMYL